MKNVIIMKLTAVVFFACMLVSQYGYSVSAEEIQTENSLEETTESQAETIESLQWRIAELEAQDEGLREKIIRMKHV